MQEFLNNEKARRAKMTTNTPGRKMKYGGKVKKKKKMMGGGKMYEYGHGGNIMKQYD